MAAGPSAIYILNHAGSILIEKDYKEHIGRKFAENFMNRMIEREDHVCPVFMVDDVTYAYIKHLDIYLLSVATGNANCLIIFTFLHNFLKILQNYLKIVTEESIRDNFVLIYEIFDEIMDFGTPQSTDESVLQQIIGTDSNPLVQETFPTPAVTGQNCCGHLCDRGAYSVKYRKNEIFIDIIETVNMMISAHGDTIYSQIVGKMKVKAFLSGLPEVRLQLNDSRLLESPDEFVNFHQAVHLRRWEEENIISFIPPEGNFELMNYNISKPFKPLIDLKSIVRVHRSRVEYLISARSLFKSSAVATNVIITIPVPEYSDKLNMIVSRGKINHIVELDAMVWTLPQFHGALELSLTADFSLSEDLPGAFPPISVKFEIPSFLVSGISVRNLKVIEKSAYKTFDWIRYQTITGDYHFRVIPLKVIPPDTES